MVWKILKLLLQFLNKPKFILGLFLSLVGTIMGLFLPQFIGKLLDKQFLNLLLSNPVTLLIVLFMFVSVYIIQSLSSYLIGSCGSLSLNKIQKYIYSSLLKTSVVDLDRFRSGDLSSRLTNDISVLLNFITIILPKFFLHIIVIAGSVYFLFTINTFMTLICLFVIPILFLAIIPLNNRLEKHYSSYQDGLGNISSQISHKFTHIRLMKAFKGETVESDKMNRFFDKQTTSFKKIIGLSAIQGTLVNGMMVSFIIILLILAGIEVSKGNMTMTTLTTFILYTTQLIDPIADISDTLPELVEFNSVSKRLAQILELKQEENSKTDHKVVSNGDIALKNVDFSYERDKVLRDISVNIPSGKHIAIVGPSGAGKSTIFSLLMKFYQGYHGYISLGGKNLTSLPVGQLRELISYIPQNNTLFQGTIRENLLYGKNREISPDRLNQVLSDLDLLTLVDSLEKGLDTEISDSGVGLSEGQKQRFNIARALLKEHPIYLLDEVTANLDSVTENIINKAIDKLTKGKTRLTIAHRMNTIRNADSILVLNKKGQVSDFGTHEQLQKRSTLYKKFLSSVTNIEGQVI